MYELIAKNKRKSVVVFFSMGILLLGLGATVGYWIAGDAGIIVGAVIALVVWGIQAIVAYRQGAKVILSGMNAKEIQKADDPMLYNNIEELSMISGLKMPKIYLIDTDAMNAFAAGTKPESCVVAITRGLRDKLNRHEIQGVMAHEMSHIYNRDVLYMTFAGVMMGTIVIISEILRRTFFYGSMGRRSSNDKGGTGQLIMILLIVVMAVFAALLARMFYFSLSRKREYLADTMAVNFTHDPSALADALQKISGDDTIFDPGKMASAMCISMPKIKEKATYLFSTHPPIRERIDILRAMSEGTTYENYCKAYKQVKGVDDLPKFKNKK